MMRSAFNFTPPPPPMIVALMDNGAPATTGAEREGDKYLDLDNMQVYEFDGSAWVAYSQADVDGPDTGCQVVSTQFSMSSSTAADIPDLPGFVPVAGAVYSLEYFLLVQSANTNTGVRPSWATPTGMDQFGYAQWTPSATYTAETSQWGGPITPVLPTSAPAANVTYGSSGQAAVKVGATPGGGNIRPRIQSESNFVQVRVMPGSWYCWERLD